MFYVFIIGHLRSKSKYKQLFIQIIYIYICINLQYAEKILPDNYVDYGWLYC